MQVLSPKAVSIAMEERESSPLFCRSRSLPPSPRRGRQVQEAASLTRSSSLKTRWPAAAPATTLRLLAAAKASCKPSALLKRRGIEGAVLKVRAFTTESFPSSSSSPPPAGSCSDPFSAASCSNTESSDPSSAASCRKSTERSGCQSAAASCSNKEGSDPSTASSSSSSRKPRSLYEILEVEPCASQEDIDTARRRLVRLHHPDKVPVEQKAASTLLFLEIQSAYSTLKDPHSRARYDLQVSLQAFRSSGYHSSPPSTPFTYPYTTRAPSTPSSPYRYTPRAPSTPPSPYSYMPRAPSTPISPYPYTPRAQASYTPYAYSPRTQASPNASTPRSQFTPPSPNYSTPRSPYSIGGNWETDQCW